ncbi:MAG TPA: cation:proton antiporter [Candidatus Mcinerneyibacterium sp.]|nr:cation:proton antiporter [Candidatus Mcinerneyibacterium sp.]
MGFDNIILELGIIFIGSAVISTFFIKIKQPVILAYIFLGMLIGPSGLKLIEKSAHLEEISHFGIILLLFLLGLDLQPSKLVKLFKKTTLVTLVTNFIFLVLSSSVLIIFNFSLKESLIAGLALMFSSTVVSVKLISVNSLHHKHIGELIISLLLIQDIIAILGIVILKGAKLANFYYYTLILLGKLVLICIFAYFFVKFIMLSLIKKFDFINEYIFVISLSWCLLLAEAAKLVGLSYEIGSFIAGVTLAISPISLYLIDRLKPLRNFFLVLFFFTLGANFDFLAAKNILIPGFIIVFILMVSKPIIYYYGFNLIKESKAISKEIGIRLGQCSEFALIVGYSAFRDNLISPDIYYLLQLVTISTFIISTFIVVKKYKTPISFQ